MVLAQHKALALPALLEQSQSPPLRCPPSGMDGNLVAPGPVLGDSIASMS